MSILRLEIPITKEKSCVKGFIGWVRLEDVLRESGDIAKDEILTHYEITDQGIDFGVVKQKRRI